MKSNLTAAVIIIFLAGITFATGTYDNTDDPAVDGSAEHPFEIATAEQLNDIGNHPEDWDKYFVMTADIDLSGRVYNSALISYSVGHNKPENPFSGSFDGNGFKIIGLTIDVILQDREIGGYLGLFGEIGPEGRVENVGLLDISINVTGDFYTHSIGAVTGRNHGQIKNCYASGEIINDVMTDYTGGIAGANGHYSSPGGQIFFCHAAVDISVPDWSDQIGGLVGLNRGSVLGCFATGNIQGGNKSVALGGLVGDNGGEISDCYATGKMKGGRWCWDLGGLAGDNYNGNIYNSYSIGQVCGDFQIGGFTGINKGDLVNSFWDTQASYRTTGLSYSYSGDISSLSGKTTAEMQTLATFIDAGWDYIDETDNGTEDIWKMSPTSYPVFSYQEIVIIPEVAGFTQEQAVEALEAATFDVSVEKNYHPDIPLGYVCSQHPIAGNQIAQYSPVKILISLGPSPFEKGDGSATNPYRIATAEELFVLAQTPEIYHLSFILTDNIDLSAPEYHLENALIAPDVLDYKYECFEGTAFTGVFDGRGHIITGLTVINTENENGGYLGLFGQVEPSGVVRNLGVEQAYISMPDSGIISGIIAGDNFGKITQCYATGELDGGYSVGGLVGQNNSDGQIYACYAEADITAWHVIGGLIGENYERGNISYCYASGHVATSSPYGEARGFLGLDSYGRGIVDSCYYLETTGSDNGYGILLSDTQMKQQNSYVGWDFVDEVVNGTEDIWWIDEGNGYPKLVWKFDTLPDLESLGQDIDDLELGGNGNSLLAKLDVASKVLEDDNENNDVAAINSLRAFINAVQAQRGKKIPEADADALIADAQEIINLLSAE